MSSEVAKVDKATTARHKPPFGEIIVIISLATAFGQRCAGETNTTFVVVSTAIEPIRSGKFQPTWESLKQYECPQWFRNAKFGIWAHWGAQCQPEQGDWYARNLYLQNQRQNRYHVEHFGPPSKFGFKDVIHEWKAENWNPDKLMALYKRAGAQYFVAMANHCDNFDNWDSKYQPWNSVNVGTKKDLIGGWARAARAKGLRFGVSVHASHAWTWFETAQGADTNGPLAGVPYDGKLTKADGKGQWWDGLDPQDLYAQKQEPSRNRSINAIWRWPTNGDCSLPDQAYCDKFYNRTVDLINKHRPDLIYFDDNVLPLWPVSDAGLKLAAHFYNSSSKWHGGKDEGVLFGKGLNAQQRKCMVQDMERSRASQIQPEPWQMDTCIGQWHYQRSLFEEHRYKSAKTMIQTLVDVVSKNGNLLLSIPVRGDGTIDADELAIVQGIGDWMRVNKECIFGTRPWKVFGEGPASASATFRRRASNDSEEQRYTAEDIRFTSKGTTLYAIVLGAPTNGVSIKSLGKSAKLLDKSIKRIELLGSKERIKWQQNDDALAIQQPRAKPNNFAIVFKIKLK